MEIGWLIEAKDPENESKLAEWLGIDKDGEAIVVTDSLEALRFAREKDADDFIRMSPNGPDFWLATEHQWG